MTAPTPVEAPAPGRIPSRHRSALLAWPGAVAGEVPDDGVAAHIGDPLREQRTLATARGR